MDKYAPVLVFTYNRIDHTRITLEALNQAELADKSDLYIFCDNYKNEMAKKQVEAVRSLVDEYVKTSRFRRIIVEKAEKNKGLKESIISGVNKIIEEYGTVIVVEDDLKVSPFFLRYMNDALSFFEQNNRIWAISGYSFPMKVLNTYSHDVYLSGRGCSWGWATWRDRWNTVDWEVPTYMYFKHNWYKRYKFSKWGVDLPLMLDGQVKRGINSWAIIWCYQAFLDNKYTVYPKKSFLINIGTDGSGTHSSEKITKFDTDLYDESIYNIRLEDLKIEECIRREFAQRYSQGFYIDLKSQIKGMLYRCGIIEYKKDK